MYDKLDRIREELAKARQKKEESSGGGAPAWMSTFSDLMNLLLCFFVLLFSMSTIDAQKFEEVVKKTNGDIEESVSTTVDTLLQKLSLMEKKIEDDFPNVFDKIKKDDFIFEELQNIRNRLPQEILDVERKSGSLTQEARDNALAIFDVDNHD